MRTYTLDMANDLNRMDVAVPPVDSGIPGQGGFGRVVVVTTPLDILQAQEAVLALAGERGFGPRDANVAVAVVSRMASALLTLSGEAVMRLEPVKGAAGFSVEGQGGVIRCDSDRRRIEASVVRLLGHDDWTVPSDGAPRASARKTFIKSEARCAWTSRQAY